MLNPQSTHDAPALSDSDEQHAEAYMAERVRVVDEGSESGEAERPRLICMGFAIIRI